MESTDVVTAESTKRVPLSALTASAAKILPILPSNLEDVWRIAKAIGTAGWAPKSYRTGEKHDGPVSEEMVAIGIMHGMEVGMSPIAALQSIAVINGMPSIWGDGALALVQSSGLLEDMKETLVKDTAGKVVGARFTAKRRGRATLIEQQFLEEDAKKANLIGKSGPWTQYPSRMYQMRARAWGLRDGFADVLKGLRIGEEAIDITPTDVTPAPAPAPSLSAPAHAEAETPIYWADDKYVEALKNWSKLIKTGKKTVEEIIEMAESKNPLTDGQKAAIRTIKALPKEGPANEAQIDEIREKAEKAAITDAEIFKKFGLTTFEGLAASKVDEILAFIANPVGG